MSARERLLRSATDPRWYDVAVGRVDELLLDHAN